QLLLRRAVPARAVLVRSRSQLADRRAWQPPVADSGRDRPDRRPAAPAIVGRQCALLPCPLCFAGLGPEARRVDPPPPPLPLTFREMGRAAGELRLARFLFGPVHYSPMPPDW